MSAPAVGASRIAQVQVALLSWYATNKRDLPWRQTRDPYAILVAEVMLQQTQVDRVIPRWHAWLQQFPTLADLARASRADAIRAWHGLGYNLRAVRLHDVACNVVERHAGALPRDVEGLLSLKGIGRYTAGAIACFAYEQPVGMVDTNIRRVLSRVFEAEPTDVEALAARVVPRGAAYAWHQALMDLGATICRSRSPLCLACPLQSMCGGPRPMPTRPPLPAQFRGSSRFYRGRLVEALRDSPDGLSLDELAARAGVPENRARLLDMVERLVDDGLLAIDLDGRVRLAERSVTTL